MEEDPGHRTGVWLEPNTSSRLRRILCAASFVLLPLLLNATQDPITQAAGVWRSDLWFIPAAVLVVVGLIPVWSRLNDRFLFGRQRALETAVRSRTDELNREKQREHSLNQVLTTLVSNRPLDEVLEGVGWLVGDHFSGAHAAILVRDPQAADIQWRLAAAPGLRSAWIEALKAPRAIPFEIWKAAAGTGYPGRDAAWNQFVQAVEGEPPLAIHSSRIGSANSPLGVILSFHSEPAPESEVASSLESAARLAQLAIEHRRSYEELHFRAHHDAMTGLPNRAELLERLDKELGEASVQRRRLAVLFVDLDHFKQINDQLSHRMGDLLLREVGDRMKNALHSRDTVARMGGDEFNVLLTEITSVADAEEAAGRLLAAIRQPFIADGNTVEATASIGIAVFPQDGATADQLLTRADAALYHAKQAGRDKAMAFSTLQAIAGDMSADADILRQLRHALYGSELAEGHFELHYQPKVTSDGKLAGLEALVRLRHPERGLIPPASFIPAAEDSGLIVPLGKWVLSEVCRQIAWWRQNGYGYVCVAVNASPVELDRPDFSESVEDCLARHGVPGWCIEIELTENIVIAGGGETIRQMRALRAIGVRFSIDDFGAGYSALGYLHQLPVDAIKLDRSFVQGLETNDAARRIVAGLIAVARGLGLNVVAEGVETDGQRIALLAAGCPQMQGYFFARPQPARDLLDLLRQAVDVDNPTPHALPGLRALANATGKSIAARTDVSALM